jgi:ABC-type lipoprotein release transport system permease subunit
MVLQIDSLDNVSAVVPRIESFALASSGDKTKGILVLGIVPELEKELTHPDNKLTQGTYLDDHTSGVMVSGRLARYLDLKLYDTLTLLSQGYHASTAAGLFPVTGIIDIPNPELDRRLVYMNLRTAQDFYDAEGRLTSLILNLDNSGALPLTMQKVMGLVDMSSYEVMDWKEMNPELVQQIESDEASGFIMLGVLYLIVGFGVLGTLIMMTTERRREFGVMVAIGMKKTKLGIVLIIEMIILVIIGIISGIAGSIPLISYFVANPLVFTGEMAQIWESYGIEPIMPAAIEPGYFIGQSLVVLVIFILAVFYPIYTVIRLKEIKAMRA